MTNAGNIMLQILMRYEEMEAHKRLRNELSSAGMSVIRAIVSELVEAGLYGFTTVKDRSIAGIVNKFMLALDKYDASVINDVKYALDGYNLNIVESIADVLDLTRDSSDEIIPEQREVSRDIEDDPAFVFHSPIKEGEIHEYGVYLLPTDEQLDEGDEYDNGEDTILGSASVTIDVPVIEDGIQRHAEVIDSNVTGEIDDYTSDSAGNNNTELLDNSDDSLSAVLGTEVNDRSVVQVTGGIFWIDDDGHICVQPNGSREDEVSSSDRFDFGNAVSETLVSESGNDLRFYSTDADDLPSDVDEGTVTETKTESEVKQGDDDDSSDVDDDGDNSGGNNSGVNLSTNLRHQRIEKWRKGNAFSDSPLGCVLSSLLRATGDVFQTVGNEAYLALLVGALLGVILATGLLPIVFFSFLFSVACFGAADIWCYCTRRASSLHTAIAIVATESYYRYA